MESDELHRQVDALLLSRGSLKVRRRYRRYLVGFLFGLACGLALFIPGVGLVSQLGVFSGGSKDDDGVSVLGDDGGDSAAYLYWYAPESSFGISESKTVNWSYFKELFDSHTGWLLEYKRYSWSDWTEGNEYLDIGKVWNESGFWKINLTFTVPVDVFEARFTFGCDLVVLDYVERSGSCVWLNYSANNTETYSVFFNWSDLVGVPGLYFDKGKTDDLFWFRFGRQNIPAGSYVFDPTFGQVSSGDWTWCYLNGNEYLQGWYASPESSGTVDNITIGTATLWQASLDIHCMIYVYTDNDTDYAGSLLANGETETRSIAAGTTNTNYVFEFVGTKPVVVGGTNYYLCVSPANDSGVTAMNTFKAIGGGNRIYKIGVNSDPAPSPLVDELYIDSQQPFIYASYTESAGGRSWQSVDTWNGSLYNLSVWNTVNTWNGSLYNFTVGWQTLNDWNGSLYNSSVVWDTVNEWNGSLYNLTVNWIAVNDWNGSLYNISGDWNTVNTWNGSLYNLSVWHTLNDWNGSLYNISGNWITVDTWNGSLYNVSGEDWNTVAAWNGSLYNLSSWNTVSVWNGSLYNISEPDAISITDEYPGNGSVNIPMQPTLYVTVSSISGKTMNVTWYSGNDTSNVLGYSLNVSNGTCYFVNYYSAVNRSTVYYWGVMVNDGFIWVNETYGFRTESLGVNNNRPSPLYLFGLFGLFGIVVLLEYRRRKKK